MKCQKETNRGDDDKLPLKQDTANHSHSPNDSLPSQNLTSQTKTACTVQNATQWNPILKNGGKYVAVVAIGFGGAWFLPTLITSSLGFGASGIAAKSTAASLMSFASTSR